MSGFYELKCIENDFDRYTYYYFYSPRAIRSPKGALRRGCAPDAVRIIIEDREESPVEIRFMHNIFEYIYKKHFKKRRFSPWDYRVDWKKEIKNFLKNA